MLRRLILSQIYPFDPAPEDTNQIWMATRPGFRRLQPRFQSPRSRYLSHFSQLGTQPRGFYREYSHRSHGVSSIAVNFTMQPRDFYRECSHRSHNISDIPVNQVIQSRRFYQESSHRSPSISGISVNLAVTVTIFQPSQANSLFRHTKAPASLVPSALVIALS